MTVHRLAPYTVTIFAEMSALAARIGAVNLGQGFPDEDGPPAMLEAAQRAIAEGVNQYPPGLGIPALRQAIADQRRRRYGTEYDPNTEVLVTVGATEAIAASALRILEAPDFAAVFGPGSRAEVGLAGHLTVAGARRLVTGRVDRMIRTDGRVLIVDYKSDRPAPEGLDAVPPAYLAQLALYREILRPLEPDAEIGAALVWTDTARLMAIPDAALDAVLARLNEARTED